MIHCTIIIFFQGYFKLSSADFKFSLVDDDKQFHLELFEISKQDLFSNLHRYNYMRGEELKIYAYRLSILYWSHQFSFCVIFESWGKKILVDNIGILQWAK